MWKRVACMALAVSIATAWLVFDDLFQPLAKRAPVVEIPDFCGLRAEELSADARFSLTFSYRYDAHAPGGVVLAQAPTAGSRQRVAAGEPVAVKLTVSLGTKQVTLPPCVGRDARAVTAELRAEGLRVHTVSRAGARPAGEVLEMEPKGGTRVPVGSEVTLTVSAGVAAESVTVPSLLGLSRADALTQLWLARLSPGEVVTVDSTAPVGTVIAQSHRAGTLVPAGTRVVLTVSGGAQEFQKGETQERS